MQTTPHIGTRVDHGLGPSMGWVGLGQGFFLIFAGMGSVGLGGDLTDIFNVTKYSTVC